MISLTSKKVLPGIIVEETSDTLKLIDNRSAPGQITTMLKTDIEDRTPSEVSIKPKCVLNKLTREEILDLLAYVLGGGDTENALFKEHVH